MASLLCTTAHKKGWGFTQSLMDLDFIFPNWSPDLTPVMCSVCPLQCDRNPTMLRLISINHKVESQHPSL